MHGSDTQWLPVICHGMRGGGSSVTRVCISLGAIRRMITRWRSINLPHEATLRLLGRHFTRSSAAVLVCLLSARASAQSTTSLLPDATVLPSGALRLRLLTSFTRWDQYVGGAISPQG